MAPGTRELLGRCGEAAHAAGAGLWRGRAEGAGAASAAAHPAGGMGDAPAPLLGLPQSRRPQLTPQAHGVPVMGSAAP